jgi:hypothetical protein
MYLNDIDLLNLVIEIDTQLLEKGVPPCDRPMQAVFYIGESMPPGAVLGSDFFAKIQVIYEKLYRRSDLVLPPMHIGVFMFRDVFFPLRISVDYGGTINPLDLLMEATAFQKKWLFNDKEIGLSFFDQSIDLMDFVYGLDDFEKSSSSRRTKELWCLARRQLEAGAAALLGSFDVYAVIQNSCIATELLLKGALTEKEGCNDDDLKEKYGHGVKKLALAVASILPGVDEKRLLSVVNKLPHYSDSRYYDLQDPKSPKYDREFSRRKVGELMMNTQFVAGEILRQFSDRDARSSFSIHGGDGLDWNCSKRSFPPE